MKLDFLFVFLTEMIQIRCISVTSFLAVGENAISKIDCSILIKIKTELFQVLLNHFPEFQGGKEYFFRPKTSAIDSEVHKEGPSQFSSKATNVFSR